MNQVIEFSLESRVEMGQVEALYQEVKSILDGSPSSGSEIVINGIAVQSISTAAIQCLLALVRSAGAESCEVSWSGVSFYLLEAAELLGLSDRLGL